MNTLTTPSLATPSMSRPWYREPYVWLVVGLPASAIAGSITAAIIAIQVMSSDPLLDRTPQPSVQLDAELLDRLSPDQRAAVEMSIAPARQARNHVSSPALPKD